MTSNVTNPDNQLDLKDPINLNDSVWTISHIAQFLGQKRDSLFKVVNSQGFPSPLANPKRNRRWLRDDIQAYFVKRSQGQLEKPVSKQIDKTQSPKSMRLKG